MDKKSYDIYRMKPESFFNLQNKEEPMFTHITTSARDPLHTHDVYEIVYVLEGTFSHFVNGVQMDLSFGDIIFLRPNDVHAFHVDDKDNNIALTNSGSRRDLVFEKNFFKAYCDSLNKDLINIYNSTRLPIKLHLSENRLMHLENLCQEYAQISPTHNNERITYTRFILTELLSLLYRKSLDQQQNPNYPLLIDQILDRFHLKALYRAGLPVILEPFNYDKSYMCRLFKQHLGVTMTEYLNKLRLNFVATQLKLTKKSVTSLCEEAGFSSLPYLNKLFKSTYGITPLKYRKAVESLSQHKQPKHSKNASSTRNKI